jgi:hypothetical protein
MDEIKYMKLPDHLLEQLPASTVAYPDNFVDQIKYYAWRLYTPLHPRVRTAGIRLGFAKNSGRQDYFLGVLAPEQSLEAFIMHLVQHGYGNHFVAWEDEGQIVSLRHVENFKYQYHLRIYNDGEIRGHYEYTPEYRPIAHTREIGMESRRDDFLKILEGWIVTDVASSAKPFHWRIGL